MKNSLTIDAHFDLLMDVSAQRGFGKRKVIEENYLPSIQKGKVDTIVVAIFVENSYLPEMGLRKALQQISALHAEVSESPDKMTICKNVNQLTEAKKNGKVGFILSLEGVEPLYDDLSLLQIFYKLGVRLVGLTHSRRNFAADGSYYSPVREGRKGGLTEFGVRLVEEAERLGMIIDVSHINDEGFWDVIQVAKKPVIASHSNSRTLANTMRNLNDDQIKAIAATNGVIGMNGVNFFISDSDESATLEGLIYHIDYIKKLVGVEHIGIGLDISEKFISPELLTMMPRKPFDAIKEHTYFPQIREGLIKHGYTEREIELIMGKNFLRVFQDVWKT